MNSQTHTEARLMLERQLLEQSTKPEVRNGADMRFLREEIDTIDSEIAGLLARRLDLALRLGQHKIELGLPVRCPKRESQVLLRVTRNLKGAEVSFATEVFKTIMSKSVEAQTSLTATKPTIPFRSVVIVGAGLIGGALARAIRQTDTPKGKVNLRAVELHDNILECAQSGLFDRVNTSLLEIAGADLIVLAASPSENLRLLKRIAPELKEGQIVMDVGSVKEDICKLSEELDLNGAEFIGGHPFFGTEKKGFKNSLEVDISGRRFCLVPTARSQQRTVDKLTEFMSTLGLEVVVITAELHDFIVARTSHLIQMLAVFAGAIINKDIVEPGLSESLILSGGGLQGLSRLMESPGDLWADIFASNSRNMDSMLGDIENLSRSMRSAPDLNRTARVTGLFHSSRKAGERLPRSATQSIKDTIGLD